VIATSIHGGVEQPHIDSSREIATVDQDRLRAGSAVVAAMRDIARVNLELRVTY
jgi:hypothetical protein